MTDASDRIVQKLRSYCNVLRDDGLFYQDCLEQLTFLLSFKMADERAVLTRREQGDPEVLHPEICRGTDSSLSST